VTINSIVRKLGIKPGMRVLIVSAPLTYLKLLAPLPEGVVISSVKDGTYPIYPILSHISSRYRQIGTGLAETTLLPVRCCGLPTQEDIRDRERSQPGSHFQGDERDRMASCFHHCDR